MLAGTIANRLSLERITVAPPSGAAALSVTVAVEVCPPATLDGFKVSDCRNAGGGGGTASIVNVSAFESAVPGFDTLTWAEPLVAMSEEGIVAVTCVPEATVVARAAPFH